MPNTDHFAQYLKGAEKWNHWRRENPHIRPDLSGHRFVFVESSLRRTSKPGLNTTTYGMFMRHPFQDFDFSHTNFTDCVFRATTKENIGILLSAIPQKTRVL